MNRLVGTGKFFTLQLLILIFWSTILRTTSLVLAGILCRYGYTDWQSNLAVRICGSDVEQCVDWLLRNESSMQTDMPVHRQEKIVRIIVPIFSYLCY
jgi:hypothetical protein